MNMLRKYIFIDKILNKYKALIFKDVVVLYGPVKVEDFMILKNFIIIFNLNMKVLVR